MLWPDDGGHSGRLAVFPVAVKGNRPELQGKILQGRLEVEEFPSGHKRERRREVASVCQQEQLSLFPHGRGYGVICMSSKPLHLAENQCVCVFVCVRGHLVSKIYITGFADVPTGTAHIVQFPTSRSVPSCCGRKAGCSTAIQKPALDSSATDC